MEAKGGLNPMADSRLLSLHKKGFGCETDIQQSRTEERSGVEQRK